MDKRNKGSSLIPYHSYLMTKNIFASIVGAVFFILPYLVINAYPALALNQSSKNVNMSVYGQVVCDR